MLLLSLSQETDLILLLQSTGRGSVPHEAYRMNDAKHLWKSIWAHRQFETLFAD